jgi:hypothetical protein
MGTIAGPSVLTNSGLRLDSVGHFWARGRSLGKGHSSFARYGFRMVARNGIGRPTVIDSMEVTEASHRPPSCQNG